MCAMACFSCENKQDEPPVIDEDVKFTTLGLDLKNLYDMIEVKDVNTAKTLIKGTFISEEDIVRTNDLFSTTLKVLTYTNETPMGLFKLKYSFNRGILVTIYGESEVIKATPSTAFKYYKVLSDDFNKFASSDLFPNDFHYMGSVVVTNDADHGNYRDYNDFQNIEDAREKCLGYIKNIMATVTPSNDKESFSGAESWTIYDYDTELAPINYKPSTIIASVSYKGNKNAVIGFNVLSYRQSVPD